MSVQSLRKHRDCSEEIVVDENGGAALILELRPVSLHVWLVFGGLLEHSIKKVQAVLV